MTVPGKGGRPRKWRSDADRVRAFRARQRGDDEPPTVEIALVDGDEVAIAWERVHELGETTREQQVELKSLRAELRRAENALEQERARFSWIEGDNGRLHSELEQMRLDRDVLHDRLDELRLSALDTPDPPSPSSAPPSRNRAQRRQAERERRRRPGGST